MPPRPILPSLGPNEAYIYDDDRTKTTTTTTTKATTATKMTDAEARAAGLLVVNLGDDWAPFIFGDGGDSRDSGEDKNDPPKPNGYRQTFVDLANERVDADGHAVGLGDHNFLEPFGIPPTLSVLRARIDDDLARPRQACEAGVDVEGLAVFAGNVGYADRDRARRDYTEALRDADWLDKEIVRRELTASAAIPHDGAAASDPSHLFPSATWKPGDRAAAIVALRGDPNPRLAARVDRTVRGQARLRAVRAAQARLVCEGSSWPAQSFCQRNVRPSDA